jgi:hypothetical protein
MEGFMPFKDAKKDLNWRKKNLRTFKLAFSRISEPDLIDWLESQESYQGAIKDMIRQKIASDKPHGGN